MRKNPKHIVKAILQRLSFYRLSKKPIILLSTRRSGTTFLMRLLFSQPGLDYVDQPLNMWDYHPHYKRLPHPFLRTFVDPSEVDEARLIEYLDGLLKGRYRLRNQWNFLEPDYSFVVDRLVLKELESLSMIEWYLDKLDADILYLVRHPIAVALSIIKLDWGETAEAYLQSPSFRNKFLYGNREEYCRKVYRNGVPLLRYVLETCLRNLPALDLARQRRCFFMTYEELLLRARGAIDLMCRRFGFTYSERMAARISEPSKNTFGLSREEITRKSPEQLLWRWLDEIGEEDQRDIQEMFDMLGVTAYNAYSPYPSEDFCHFGLLSGARSEK